MYAAATLGAAQNMEYNGHNDYLHTKTVEGLLDENRIQIVYFRNKDAWQQYNNL